MKCDDQIVNRIKRTHGQMNGVLKMMEQDTDCEQLVIQLKAIRSSIEKTIGLITANNLIQSIEKEHSIEVRDIKDALDLIVKSI
ncbi:regulator protein FrmR [Acholeplasma oculi]|uniref:Metal-sensitive transcriptional repressor n=1 Tax=Acholeplasma oculi TaxID=35623 RepID=A0A061ACE5_9MOLU|nr:metal-sensing transcriptional repressor [Acholeplasma oculi]CDR31084.1 Metal-sensitive transcriptional repressor [Acholeplasma oculi]SKC36887.1 DNA-binding transcriptional regulator, FrmR family [Acholeplasma oculi]SUT90730.1 regulator protein FrmR [Acholeplasma oculi]